MGLQITCDKCGNDVDEDFVLMQSTFYTTKDTEPVDFCALGDEFYLCDKCYDKILKEVE